MLLTKFNLFLLQIIIPIYDVLEEVIFLHCSNVTIGVAPVIEGVFGVGCVVEFGEER